MSSMAVNLGAEEAITKAKKFLEAYHSTIDLISADLNGSVWEIVFNVGFLTNQYKLVKVDAENGKLLGYNNVS